MSDNENYKASMSITPQIDIANEEIKLNMVEKFLDLPGRYAVETIHLKDNAIRAGLIALGWTPPPSTPPTSKEIARAMIEAQLLVDVYGSAHGQVFFCTNDGEKHDIGKITKIILMNLTETKKNLASLLTFGDIMQRALWPHEELELKEEPFGTRRAPPIVCDWREFVAKHLK